jgi:hypothetical protein
MRNENSTSLIDDLRSVIKDGIDYLGSVVALLQARLTQYALSTILFFLLIAFSSLLLIAAFVFFNIAIGVGLAHALGNPMWALLILGSFYFLLSAILGGVALSWLKRLKS